MDPAGAASDPWLRSRAAEGRFLRQTGNRDCPASLVRARGTPRPAAGGAPRRACPAMRASSPGRLVRSWRTFGPDPRGSMVAPMVHRARIIHGTAVSPGLAVGPVHVARSASQAVPTWSVREEDLEREVARLHGAIRSA